MTDRIDAHHHFWEYNSIEYGWISDEMAAIRVAAQPVGDEGPRAPRAGLARFHPIRLLGSL